MDSQLAPQKPFRYSAIAAYAAMVLGGIAVFLLVRSYGETLTAPPPGAAAAVGPVPGAVSETVLHLLLALTAVMLTGRLLGALLRSVGQPPVIGEVVAGILLGPSLLGRVAPEVSACILPASVAPFLNVVAQLGVVLYMFLVGLELNSDLLRERAHATVATSHASIVTPLVLGSILALILYPGCHRATFRSRASRCSWASRCRSPHFRCWRGS